MTTGFASTLAFILVLIIISVLYFRVGTDDKQIFVYYQSGSNSSSGSSNGNGNNYNNPSILPKYGHYERLYNTPTLVVATTASDGVGT